MADAKPTVKLLKFSPLAIRKEFEDEENNSALLQWSLRMGYPKLYVYTDNKKDSETKTNYDHIIRASFNTMSFYAFLQGFEAVIKSEKDTKQTIKCYNNVFVDRQRTDKIGLEATVIVGKKDGIVYLAAIEEGKKKVKFELMPNLTYHKFFDKEGAEITNRAELSLIHAKSYLKFMNDFMLPELKEYVVTGDMVKKPAGGRDKHTASTETTVVKGESSTDLDEIFG